MVVEPNDLLCQQTAEKLNVVDYAITVTTIKRLFEEGPWHEIIIINEFDIIFSQSPYVVQAGIVKGIWQFRERKVFAFSATSSVPHERLVNNVIGMPKVLKFKSEYELVHGSSPIADP